MHLDARGNHALQLHFFWSRPVQEGLAATTKMLHALRDDAVIGPAQHQRLARPLVCC